MIDMTKKYKTRDGRDVRILCVDGTGERPVVGIAGQDVFVWTASGSHPVFLNADLIEQGPEVELFVPLVAFRNYLTPRSDGSALTLAEMTREVDITHPYSGHAVGYLRITQPAGNTDPTKITVEVVPLP